MRSAILEISLLLAAFILGWLKTGWNSLFYIALGLIVFYIIVMVIYIVTKGSTMSWFDKLLGLIALAGWLAIAWAIIQEKGLHLWGLL
ncbi:MAG: hypothetical protein PHT79_12085 [Syntrophomonadaceae bacterium]|nr:hypothetical protein [Syntrophomonadaceae bacterium]MDD3890236.1 hypothetical protein [Syntrophomonadaceae bacterium]MDD4550482.1 hypothetical protein [Syntrophomonadaceae bacterium]